MPVSRASVFIVSPTTGRTPVGITDENGEIFVKKALLAASSDGVLVLCADGLECSAVQLDAPGLLDGAERIVHLGGRIYL